MTTRMMSILLISVMMYKPMMCTWTMVDFALNRTYISSYLCENQDRPELACQGKCFLMQKLKKQANQSGDHQTKQLSQWSKIEVMNVQGVPIFCFQNAEFQIIVDRTEAAVNNGYLTSIFHPPMA